MSEHHCHPIPLQVFKDNCCKREVLNLYVFCKNLPDCNSKIILGRYQVSWLNHILSLWFSCELCVSQAKFQWLSSDFCHWSNVAWVHSLWLSYTLSNKYYVMAVSLYKLCLICLIRTICTILLWIYLSFCKFRRTVVKVFYIIVKK